MTVCAVRKRDGKWTICSEQSTRMLFDSYEEALEVARTAAGVIADSTQSQTSKKDEAHTLER
jgi:hypothetical protein